MHSSKPNLPDILRRTLLRGRQRRPPQIILVEAAVLVDRHRVPSGANDGILPVEAQVDRRGQPSIGAHRVPRRFLRRLRLLRVHPQDVWDQLFVPRLQQSEHMEQAAHRSRCIGAAAEAEDENIVAFLVGVHQVAIRVPDDVQQPLADGQAQHLRPPFRQAPVHVRRSQRAHARMVVSNLLVANLQRVVQLHDVGVGLGLVKVVARPVAADHDVLWHGRPSRSCG